MPARKLAPAPPTTTLNVRGIDTGAARAIKAAAQSRGMTIGQYLHRLLLLHVAVRDIAERGDAEAGRVLGTLWLETVRT